MKRCSLLAPLLALALAPVLAGPAGAQPKTVSAQEAQAVQARLLTLDTHLDTPAHFAEPGWDIMDRHSADTDASQVDYPRMVEGGLDGGFFAIFTPAKPLTPEGDHASRDAAILRASEIREMVARHSDHFALALKADDAQAIVAQKKRVVFMSMENSQPVEADLSLVKTFYELGVRLIGPVHFKTNDLADSATDAPKWHGLSPKGRELVAQANRLGMVLDASHASDDVFDQMLTLSKTPIILSHSGARAVFDHPRNIDDARLKALAAKGGVIQVLAFNSYMIDIPKNAERDAAFAALQADMSAKPPRSQAESRAYVARRNAILAKFPVPHATFETFMAHLDHAIAVAGVDHVGIGLDLDGGGGLTGLQDVADDWKITQRLLDEGHRVEDLQKIWSGNVLRVLRAAEAEAAREQAAPQP
jgi:membrane dipeptidase